MLHALTGCDCRGGVPCTDDDDCDDGQFCTRDICNVGRCLWASGGICDFEAGFYCSEAEGRCVLPPMPDAGYDGGPPLCEPAVWSSFGAECHVEPWPTCVGELDCRPDLTLDLDGVFVFLRAFCTRECDPSSDRGCAFCAGVCEDRLRAGSVHLDMARWGAGALCHVPCEPSLDDDGCERPFHGCDPVTGTCQQACRGSEECRLVLGAAGEVRFDPDHPGACDFVTGRCRRPGTAGARAGDACTRDSECMDDGTCLRAPEWGDGGYCVRFDCQWAGLPCGDGEVCERRILERPACVRACTVGAEPEPDRIGPGGHGDGCSPGLSCRFWDGAGREPLGACVPGNYNAVAEPNFGAACARDEECWSPYGNGRCLGAEPGVRGGFCAVRECFAGTGPAGDRIEGLFPGVPASPPICPESTMPVRCTERGGVHFCLPRCAMADDCPVGLACVDAGGGVEVCFPDCDIDLDCRPGEACRNGERACDGALGCRCTALP